MPESPNKGGRKPRVSDEDLLTAFRSTSDPVLSTAEIANEVPIKRRGTLRRLRSLEESGTLESKQIGGRNTVWWLIDDESDEATREPGGTVDLPEGGEGETEPTGDPNGVSESAEWFPDLSDELSGSGSNLEGRIQAARDIHKYLKENGSGKKSDFKEVVDIEATGFGGEKPFNSFWKNCMDSGAVLGKLPGVERPGEGGHTYRYEQ